MNVMRSIFSIVLISVDRGILLRWDCYTSDRQNRNHRNLLIQTATTDTPSPVHISPLSSAYIRVPFRGGVPSPGLVEGSEVVRVGPALGIDARQGEVDDPARSLSILRCCWVEYIIAIYIRISAKY